MTRLIIILLPTVFLFACTSPSGKESRIGTDTVLTVENPSASVKKTESTPTLRVDTFTEFPPFVDGCSCYYSSDSAAHKSGVYLFVMDMYGTALMKIEGADEKLKATGDRESYFGGGFSLENDRYTVDIKTFTQRQSGYETTEYTGELTITSKDGARVTVPFFGECGC